MPTLLLLLLLLLPHGTGLQLHDPTRGGFMSNQVGILLLPNTSLLSRRRRRRRRV